MSFVYVLRSEGGMCKVGMAKNPQSRMRELMTGHPFGLELVEAFETDDAFTLQVEQRAHSILALKRMRGEWFAVEAEEAVAAVRLAAGSLLKEVEPEGEPMSTQSHRKCSSCEFCHRHACRRRAPVADGEGSTRWPSVAPEDWCGEWRPDPNDI